jgi:uncharacterized protein DUF3800
MERMFWGIHPWHVYLDESYNSHVFCVGGLLAPAGVCDRLAAQWADRLAYENRRSAKKSLPPISRYHATDCANLKREFRTENGWSVDRQILFSKRLCEIIRDSGIWVVAIGGLIEDIKPFLPPGDVPKGLLCNLCLRMALVDISAIVRERYAGAKVTLFYDQGYDFGSEVVRVFKTFKDGIHTSDAIAECFETAEPKDSRECLPLQTADFIAYETMKRIDGLRKGRGDLRKALRHLHGSDTTLIMEQFTSEIFADMARMIMNRQSGRHPWEGVTSKMVDILP